MRYFYLFLLLVGGAGLLLATSPYQRIFPFGLTGQTLEVSWKHGLKQKQNLKQKGSLKQKQNLKQTLKDPIRVAIIGLVHTHVHWILGREDRGVLEVLGIVEPNRDLAEQYSRQHGYSMDLVFPDLETLFANVQPEAVFDFGTIKGHLATVEFCAPRGVHVMVEKPLAASLEDAERMVELAREHDIQLLTNYETSWYATNQYADQQLNTEKRLGELRRLNFYTGHPGPIEIGCNEEFLEWLTDPVLNGGGALTDFGCYGANQTTWLSRGIEPLSVSAVTQSIKPHMYPKVEDEAMIVVTYPGFQSLIMASWNWPYNRKEMTVYGTGGSLHRQDGQTALLRPDTASVAEEITPPSLPRHIDDPFTLFHAVLRGQHQLSEWDVSGLKNNLRVVQILEAAKISARTGKTIDWSTFLALRE